MTAHYANFCVQRLSSEVGIYEIIGKNGELITGLFKFLPNYLFDDIIFEMLPIFSIILRIPAVFADKNPARNVVGTWLGILPDFFGISDPKLTGRIFPIFQAKRNQLILII